MFVHACDSERNGMEMLVGLVYTWIFTSQLKSLYGSQLKKINCREK